MKRHILILLLSSLSMIVLAQTIPSADEVMTEAYATAKKENKKVFIMFHASWCGWCHKMDASMNEPNLKKYFDDSYVIRHLVVMESKGKENLENAGGMDMMKKYHGENSGIPFWLVFDANGNLLADSKLRPQGGGSETGDNVGCPAKPEEVAYFIEVLKKTTKLRENELALISERFKKNAN